MRTEHAQAGTNQLIERLLPRDSERFFDESEEVDLRLGDTLAEAGLPLTDVLFPISSFVSLTTTAQTAPRSTLELTMVGREGVVGVSVILGVDRAPHHALVQGAGIARRLSTSLFTAQLDSSPRFKLMMQQALFLLLQQTTTTAACTHFHRIEERLARWLLMSHDRSPDGEFRVTHEFLGLMLGVQRVGVTRAAGNLQRRELIHYQRGLMTILDRPGLEAASCGCYVQGQADYRDIMRAKQA